MSEGKVSCHNRRYYFVLDYVSLGLTKIGASGLGKAYAKAFVEAGSVPFFFQGPEGTNLQFRAYVTIGDRNETLGTQVTLDLGK